MDVEELIADFPSDARHAIRAVTRRRGAEALRALQTAGIQLDVASNLGFTALFVAAVAGDVATVRAFLEAGANPNGDPSRAPIYAAMGLRDPEVANILLAAGASPNGRLVNRPAILEATMLGNLPGLETLLKAGADVNLTNSVGMTALIEGGAAMKWRAVERLLEAGADPWVPSDMGLCVGLFAYDCRLLPTTPDGQARTRVMDRLKRAGFPWPPPDAASVRASMQAGNWPPIDRRVD